MSWDYIEQFYNPSNEMNPYQNPTIYLGSLRIDEPITTVTDLLFIAVCFFAFFKTRKTSSDIGLNLYRWFFLLTGASTLVAALIGHAFLYYFGAEAKIYGWVTGIFGTCFAQFAALYHTRNTIGEFTFKLLITICVIEVLIAFIAVFKFWTFVVVEVHSAFVLVLMVTLLEYINYKKTKSPLSLYMIYGVGVAVIAVLCHVFKLAFSVWFNHADLSHVFMAISMYLMYKGASLYQTKQIESD
jgi:hypothetical protein